MIQRNIKSRVNEKSYAVIVKPVSESANVYNEQLKEKMINEMSKVLNVRVKAVRKTRKTSVATATVSEREISLIKECAKFNKLGLELQVPRKIGPKVVMHV